jgi:hypothetical protein
MLLAGREESVSDTANVGILAGITTGTTLAPKGISVFTCTMSLYDLFDLEKRLSNARRRLSVTGKMPEQAFLASP